MTNSISVKLQNKFTSTVELKVGVREGDNPSSNIFKVLINELPSLFNNNDEPVKLGNISLNCLLYVDDLVLISETERGLQQCINKLEGYCYGLSDGQSQKDKNSYFCKNGKKSMQNFFYENKIIEQVSSYKYLRIIFSSSGSFTNCQNDLYKRALKMYFRLVKCFGNIKGIGSILFLKNGLKKFLQKNYNNHFRKNNYEVCTAVARCFPNILYVIVLENIIGRPPYWSNDRDLVFCHQPFIYAFSSVYFNCTLISYVHWT
jgi:hypothetical protein